VRGTAASALRSWLQRSGDYGQELWRILQESKGYSKDKADLIIKLLQRLTDEELASPSTYQMLIGYLNHDNLVIRELALWHLYYLVPEGTKTIPYDPTGDAQKRQDAVVQWKKLLPEGKLPASRSAGRN